MGVIERPEGRSTMAADDGGFTNGEAAAGYAQNGIRVFPCVARSKRPHTEHGFKDATTDLAQIAEWWGRWPDANVAMPTSGLLVVDIDPRNGGNESWDRLRAQHGALPQTAEAITGGGGRHIIFRDPGVRAAASWPQVSR